MAYLIGLASMAMSLFTALSINSFEGEGINALCFPALAITYCIFTAIAANIEDKLKRRIEALEKKIDDMEKGE